MADAFEGSSLDTTSWAYSGNSPILERWQGDQVVRVDYQSPSHAFYRTDVSNQGYRLTGGMIGRIEFQVTASSDNIVLAINTGLNSQSYQRFGIRYKSGAFYLHTCTDLTDCDNTSRSETDQLLSNVAYNAWYVLLWTVDGQSPNWKLRFYLWPRDAPDLMVQRDLATTTNTGTAWRFMEKTYAGTARLDEYSEGSLYTWDLTFYKVCTPSAGTDSDTDCPSAITLAGISQPLSNYNGFAIYWVRTAKDPVDGLRGTRQLHGQPG